MANSTASSLGRFSSQMLTYLGTQRTVKSVTGSPNNTYKYASGPTFFPNPSSLQESLLGLGVSGAYSADWYNTTKCYFLSRGASKMYADSMAAIVIDMASFLGTTPQALLEQTNTDGKLMFSDNAYRSFNALRDAGHQVGTVTSVSNKLSLKSKEIRS